MLSQSEIEALLLSLKVATSATLLLFPIALALAFLLARYNFRGKMLLEIMVYFPLVVPPVVIGYLLLVFLSPASAFGAWLETIGLNPSFSWQAAALASGIMAMPLMVRAIRQSFETQAIIFNEVAATLGAGPFRQFLTISLPLALPGIATAIVLGFARSIGEFGATITFAANIPGLTQTLPLALYTEAQTPGGETAALRLAILCLIPAVLSLFISETLSRRARAKAGLRP
ncbi:molybdate ABC transporter permease subunit [Kordiimonas sp. SCSIO 12610]|uniref:molybdate ABC transporter permease subunit n=1 Tax=Kordiimonas sp. SCSIO 12610 TaxID=2829597 RepID=UPI00210C0652|nr:molybdate ABC transporter permease subunit [Kordiimonas sp. SCSIO 12610]